jgi:SAM-dependent methyltransferase
MPERVDCNLCGGADSRVLYSLRDYRYFTDTVEWDVVRCQTCGLGYLNPRPTQDEIERYYPSRYFESRETMGERYQRQAEYVRDPRGKLLDVGAARGDFMEVMRRRGWDVEGIERFDGGNPYGLPIHRLSFPHESPLADGLFDVVTAWAVFEHLYDPKLAFQECVRMLRPGGSLIVQVPNLRSIYGRFSRLEDVPRHLYFYSPKTLRKYGERAGAKLERVLHVTDLFGGASGRGVLRLALARSVGKSVPEFFEIYRSSRSDRFTRWPYLSVAWTGVAAVERILIPDWAVRALRMSGQIIACFRRPVADAEPTHATTG